MLSNKQNEEENLIQIAQWEKDDKIANAAMVELREKYDPTYHYCMDCDGLVTTTTACCLNNREQSPEIDEEDLPF